MALRKSFFYFFLVLTSFVPVHSQEIIGPDELELDSLGCYSHSFPSGGTYYWIASGATIINFNNTEINLSYSTDGFYRVQLWHLPSGNFVDEKKVVAGNPPIFEFEYDSAGNRLSRQIIYYDSGKKSLRETDEIIKENLAGEFNLFPNPVQEILYLTLPIEADPSVGNWKIYLYDNMGQSYFSARN
jgi:hypothetical protein